VGPNQKVLAGDEFEKKSLDSDPETVVNKNNLEQS
jgi:hypothetical protein